MAEPTTLQLVTDGATVLVLDATEGIDLTVFERLAHKGVANGYAAINGSGQVLDGSGNPVGGGGGASTAYVDAGDATNATAIAVEAAARASADTALTTTVGTKAATTALTAETSARTSVDVVLQTAVDGETAARIAADAAHVAATDPHADRAYTDTQVSAEATARAAAITAAIDALIAGAPGALDTLAEIATQLATDESAVSALTTTVAAKASSAALTAEVTRATTAEGTKADTSALTAETSRATTAEATKLDASDVSVTNARTPTAHAASHASAGSDAVTLAESQVTGLVSDLAAKAPTSRLISAGTGLTGGGDLAADRTLTVAYGATGTTATVGNDSRLSDTRTPTDATVTTAKLVDGSVTLAKLANVATATIRGRTTAGTGTPEDLTAAQARAVLYSGTPTGTKFARDDGTYATPAGGSLVVTRSVGDWYSQNGNVVNTNNHGLSAAGNLRAIPVYLHAGNLDAIGVYLSAVGTSTWRLGMYPADPTTLLPSGQTRAFDAGTIDMSTATSARTLTIAYTVPTAGLYWLVAVVDAYTSLPTVQGWDNNSASSSPPMNGIPIQFNGNRYPMVARYATGIAAGGLPATCPTLAGWFATAPRIAVRAAT